MQARGPGRGPASASRGLSRFASQMTSSPIPSGMQDDNDLMLPESSAKASLGASEGSDQAEEDAEEQIEDEEQPDEEEQVPSSSTLSFVCLSARIRAEKSGLVH